MGLMLSACSDFLDRKPLTQPDNTTFLSGREQVENYINALYPALPAPAQVWEWGVRGRRGEQRLIFWRKSMICA